MTADSELLRRYLQNQDEAAFGELVRRYVNLVYAAALRVTNGDSALAEDATQAAFRELARKAGELTGRATLAGWLHTTARFVAMRGVRTEQRRRARELGAQTMNDPTDADASEISWEQLRPALDEVVGELEDEDREAVLLRYFQGKSHREVGEFLGLNENSARMRVERALDKMRAKFTQRGVTTTAALLAGTLGLHGASTAAPAEVAATMAGKSLAGASGATPSPIAIKNPAAAARPRAALVAAVVVLVVGIAAFAHFHAKVAPPSAPVPAPAAQKMETPAPPAAAPPVNAAKPDAPRNLNNLGTVSFAPPNVHSEKTYTLSSGLTFMISLIKSNANGTILVSYGAYEPGKQAHMKMISGYTAPPDGPLELNADYTVPVQNDAEVDAALPHGEVVRFTPSAPPLDVNRLGTVHLTIGETKKFTLHSGKIFTLMLSTRDNEADRQMMAKLISQQPNHGFEMPPPEIKTILNEMVYPSEAVYEENTVHGGGSGTAPPAGVETQFDIGGTNETVTFTLQY